MVSDACRHPFGAGADEVRQGSDSTVKSGWKLRA